MRWISPTTLPCDSLASLTGHAMEHEQGVHQFSLNWVLFEVVVLVETKEHSYEGSKVLNDNWDWILGIDYKRNL